MRYLNSEDERFRLIGSASAHGNGSLNYQHKVLQARLYNELNDLSTVPNVN